MALKSLDSFSKEEFKQFIDSFDAVLTDCDGVLWVGNDPFPGSAEVMNRFKELGKKTFFVTNNSTKTRSEFVQKCNNLGFKASVDEIVSTAYLAALYLNNSNFDRNKKVYIIGSKGISQELDLVGIKHCGVGPDVISSDVPTYLSTVNLESDIGAVIVGFDEHFSFPKMLKAATYLNDPEVHFVATNKDERFPHSSKIIIPGSGSIVNAISTCAERDPFIVGKPEAYLREAVIRGNGLNPKRTLMIGDRCNTDILLGTRCGFHTLLVLTGVTRLSEVSKWKSDGDELKSGWIPDIYANKLGDLLEKML
ncbi:glycerol-3-phosphate phosphatase-like isoform X2 [Lycorma delicatula]